MSIKVKFLIILILIATLAALFGIKLLELNREADGNRERIMLSNNQAFLLMSLKSQLQGVVKEASDLMVLGEKQREEYEFFKIEILKIITELEVITLSQKTIFNSLAELKKNKEIYQFQILKKRTKSLIATLDKLVQSKLALNERISPEYYEKYFEKQFDDELIFLIDKVIKERQLKSDEINKIGEMHSNQVKIFTYYLWGISFLVSIIVLFLLYRSLVIPLLQLKNAAIQVAKNNYFFNLETNSADEFGEVAAAFLNMADQVKINIEDMESTLNLILGNSNDAIISVSLDGIIMNWNQGAEKIYGYSAMEAKGCNISLLIPDELLDEAKAIQWDIRRNKTVDLFETKRIVKNGSVIDVALNVNAMKNSEGVVIGISSISREIQNK